MANLTYYLSGFGKFCPKKFRHYGAVYTNLLLDMKKIFSSKKGQLFILSYKVYSDPRSRVNKILLKILSKCTHLLVHT